MADKRQRGGASHRIFLALRRANPEALFEWTAVRGLRLVLYSDRKDRTASRKGLDTWRDLKLFTYRDGPVVFVVEETTGCVVAVGPTAYVAKANLLEILETVSKPELFADIAETFESVNPGPKPTVKMKVTC